MYMEVCGNVSIPDSAFNCYHMRHEHEENVFIIHFCTSCAYASAVRNGPRVGPYSECRQSRSQLCPASSFRQTCMHWINIGTYIESVLVAPSMC